jgi:hypothetical protein
VQDPLLVAKAEFVESLADLGPLPKNLRSRRIRLRHGEVAVATASEKNGRWWLGLDGPACLRDGVAGAVLLCVRKDRTRLVFGLPRSTLESIRTAVSEDAEGREWKLNVVERDGRCLLLLPRAEALVLDPFLDDLRWLPGRGGPEPRAAAGGASAAAPAGPEQVAAIAGVFARVAGGNLVPLDALPWDDGTIVLLRGGPAPSVPSAASLRRILAAEGIGGLPADFAERHDEYAHGRHRA